VDKLSPGEPAVAPPMVRVMLFLFEVGKVFFVGAFKL
jgi:hypothetical protein